MAPTGLLGLNGGGTAAAAPSFRWLSATNRSYVAQITGTICDHPLEQQLGRTTLQTVNLRHPCVQCRWSSLLECLTGLFKVGRSFVRCF